MRSERDDLLEHMDRYRAVTLVHLDCFADEELAWRPRPDAFSVGQQFVHLLHSEDFYVHGLFDNDWDLTRVRFRRFSLRAQISGNSSKQCGMPHAPT